ncbi:hypothetical protein FZI93_20700 [Mycobacterium sp. CBMA361]|nr:hypothetical protein [Mycolicibacterium sp. CBMA 361]
MYIDILRQEGAEYFTDPATEQLMEVLLRTVSALYDGLSLYDLARESHRKKIAEVRAFFTAMLIQTTIGESHG